MSRRVKIALVAVAGGMVLSCGLCGGCLYSTYREVPNVEAASAAFLDLLSQGRVDDAYGTTAPALQNAISIERFRALIAQFPRLTSPATRTRGAYRVYTGTGGPQSQMAYTLADATGRTALTLSLVKTEGRWRVIALNVQY